MIRKIPSVILVFSYRKVNIYIRGSNILEYST